MDYNDNRLNYIPCVTPYAKFVNAINTNVYCTENLGKSVLEIRKKK